MPAYFVRLGPLAELRAAISNVRLSRHRRVVVRTADGLRIGEIVAPCRAAESDDPPIILRPTSGEDELLIRRLARHRREAVEKCRAALAEAGSNAVLLDVDPLLDGTKLMLHFLGQVDDRAERIAGKIVDEYESIVRTRHFTKLLRDGCGPACGTQNAGGCGTEGCSGCPAPCKPNFPHLKL